MTCASRPQGSHSKEEVSLERVWPGWQKAEQLAKEIRHPYLVHSKTEIEAAYSKMDIAFDQFKANLQSDFRLKDLIPIAGLILAIEPIKKMSPSMQAVSILYSGIIGMDLGEEYLNRVKNHYSPVVQAYSELHPLCEKNKQASLIKCINDNYQPELSFSPVSPQQDSNHSLLVDKNNPNPENLVVTGIP